MPAHTQQCPPRKTFETQGRLPSLSGQDPLLQIVTSTASTAAPLSILSRGSSSLGPGLDIGFREDPVNIAATAAATDDDASPAGRNGNNGIGHGSNTRDDDRPRPAENGRSAGEEPSKVGTNRSSSHPNEVRVEPVNVDTYMPHTSTQTLDIGWLTNLCALRSPTPIGDEYDIYRRPIL